MRERACGLVSLTKRVMGEMRLNLLVIGKVTPPFGGGGSLFFPFWSSPAPMLDVTIQEGEVATFSMAVRRKRKPKGGSCIIYHFGWLFGHEIAGVDTIFVLVDKAEHLGRGGIAVVRQSVRAPMIHGSSPVAKRSVVKAVSGAEPAATRVA